MNRLRLMLLTGVVALGGLVLGSSTANAQVVRQPAVVYQRVNPGPVYYGPAPHRVIVYPGSYYPVRQFAAPSPRVMPHSHRDWSTGRENLPLAKPWLHSPW